METVREWALTPTKHLPRARHCTKTLTCILSLLPHDNPILSISILQMWKLRPRDVKSVTQGPQLASGGARIHTQALTQEVMPAMPTLRAVAVSQRWPQKPL